MSISLPKWQFFQPKKVFPTNFCLREIQKNSIFVVQITKSSSQLLTVNSIRGGLFLFLEQKSASKALKTYFFAYFSGQWVGSSPSSPGYAIYSTRLERRMEAAQSVRIRDIMSLTHEPTITNCCYAIGISSPSQEKN